MIANSQINPSGISTRFLEGLNTASVNLQGQLCTASESLQERLCTASESLQERLSTASESLQGRLSTAQDRLSTASVNLQGRLSTASESLQDRLSTASVYLPNKTQLHNSFHRVRSNVTQFIQSRSSKTLFTYAGIAAVPFRNKIVEFSRNSLFELLHENNTIPPLSVLLTPLVKTIHECFIQSIPQSFLDPIFQKPHEFFTRTSILFISFLSSQHYFSKIFSMREVPSKTDCALHFFTSISAFLIPFQFLNILSENPIQNPNLFFNRVITLLSASSSMYFSPSTKKIYSQIKNCFFASIFSSLALYEVLSLSSYRISCEAGFHNCTYTLID